MKDRKFRGEGVAEEDVPKSGVSHDVGEAANVLSPTSTFALRFLVIEQCVNKSYKFIKMFVL